MGCFSCESNASKKEVRPTTSVAKRETEVAGDVIAAEVINDTAV